MLVRSGSSRVATPPIPGYIWYPRRDWLVGNILFLANLAKKANCHILSSCTDNDILAYNVGYHYLISARASYLLGKLTLYARITLSTQCADDAILANITILADSPILPNIKHVGLIANQFLQPQRLWHQSLRQLTIKSGPCEDYLNIKHVDSSIYSLKRMFLM